MSELPVAATGKRRRLTLDNAVNVAIITLCVGLTADMAMRYMHPVGASTARDVPAERRTPTPPPEAPLPSEPLSLALAAMRGDPTAPVAIIAYSDFQCPYCRVFAQTIWPELQRTVIDTGQARFAFRHLPLDAIHPLARRVGAVAECARQSGKFWEFHDAVFTRQADLATVDMGDLAASVGLPKPVVLACADGPQASAAVSRDTQEAARLGVRGTPTFFVGRVQPDGRVRVTQRLVGAQAVEAFQAAVAAAGELPR